MKIGYRNLMGMVDTVVYQADAGDGSGNGGEGNLDAGGSETKEGGTQTPPWMGSLPDEMKSNEVLAKYPKLGDVMKEFVTLKSSEVIRIPGEDATPEARAEFWKAIGRPDSPEGYEIKPIDMPEGFEHDTEHASQWAQWAHELGIPKAAAEQLYAKNQQYGVSEAGKLTEAGKAEQAKAQAETMKQLDAIKATWGKDAEQNIEAAHRAFIELGGEAAQAAMETYINPETGVKLGNDPAILQQFHRIAKLIAEDKLYPGGAPAGKQRNVDSDGRPTLSFPSMAKR